MHTYCYKGFILSLLLPQWFFYMVQVGAKKSEIKNKNIFRLCPPPHPSLKVCVVVPAKDEENTIVATLDALRKQVHKSGSRLSFCLYEVLLLANNCTDNTFLAAKKYALRFPEFQLHVFYANISTRNANIGYVRRILMDEACRRLLLNNLKNGIIASTDGDTIVDRYWISNIMDEIALGSDAVGGRILSNTINSSARLYYLRDVSYRLLQVKAAALIDPEKNNPWPCHHQYFGASLAVTCSMYDYCGRLPGVPHLEDMALYNSLVKVDAKIRCSPLVKVYTSGRINGRVKIGFSEQLKQWARSNTKHWPQMVEPAESLLLKLKCKKLLRRCFETFTKMGVVEEDIVKIITDHLLIDCDWLCDEIAESTYFGALWQATEEAIGEGNYYEDYPGVLITDAIFELKRFLLNN